MLPIAQLFFATSVTILLAQLLGLKRQLSKTNIEPLVRKGMIRTVACRVISGISYTILSGSIYFTGQNYPVATIVVFIGVQVMFLTNTLSDFLLRKKLEPKHGRHRR